MDTSNAIFSPDWNDATSKRGEVALFLHGFGSHEGDLAGLAPWLPKGMPWVSLRAPLPLNGMGFAWFPLNLPQAPDQGWIDDATAGLWEWVDANLSPSTSLVPVGFSQGGLMALQLLRTRPERIAATVVLAGLMTSAPQPADAHLADARPPVFWGRGDADTVIPAEGLAHLAEFLPTHSSLTARVYPGLTHSVDERVLDDVQRFLEDAVQPTSAGHSA